MQIRLEVFAQLLTDKQLRKHNLPGGGNYREDCPSGQHLVVVILLHHRTLFSNAVFV